MIQYNFIVALILPMKVVMTIQIRDNLSNSTYLKTRVILATNFSRREKKCPSSSASRIGRSLSLAGSFARKRTGVLVDKKIDNDLRCLRFEKRTGA